MHEEMKRVVRFFTYYRAWWVSKEEGAKSAGEKAFANE